MSVSIQIGIDESNRKMISEGLSRVLADSYTLYLKTHHYHWNVTGPNFTSLHQLFETQYQDLAEAVDLLAERIRALGFFAPGSYRAFSKLTSIPEEDEDLPSADVMVQRLVEGHEAVIGTARSVIPIAEAGKDSTTEDLLTERLRLHEKTVWMLRAILA